VLCDQVFDVFLGDFRRDFVQRPKPDVATSLIDVKPQPPAIAPAFFDPL
jgi:hypothetical protein